MDISRVPDAASTTPPEWAEVDALLEGAVVENQESHGKISSGAQTLAVGIRSAISLSGQAPSLPDVVFREISTSIARDQTAISGERRVRVEKPARYVGAWAVVAVLLLATVTLMRGSHPFTGSSQHQQVSPVTVYTTAPGQRANIELPDGSTITLNVASRLEVPINYMHGDHALRLSGEALFTVRHHDDVPLTVTAGMITTRVLGTSFLVRRYPTDSATVVAVRDGKVAVGAHQLTAMQQLSVTRAGIVSVHPVDSTRFTFATGVLAVDAPLSSLIPELNRWYSADIRLHDPSLGRLRLTGGMKEGSLEDLMTRLALALDVRAVRDGKTITLYPR